MKIRVSYIRGKSFRLIWNSLRHELFRQDGVTTHLVWWRRHKHQITVTWHSAGALEALLLLAVRVGVSRPDDGGWPRAHVQLPSDGFHQQLQRLHHVVELAGVTLEVREAARLRELTPVWWRHAPVWGSRTGQGYQRKHQGSRRSWRRSLKNNIGLLQNCCHKGGNNVD